MRKLLLVLFFTAMGMFEGSAQSLIQTYTDRCTGATTVFSVPLNGSTVVTFYNKSRNVSAQDIYNGSFQAWLEETYQWWAALSPCSTNQNEATNTTQQTQQTAQNAAQAATNAAQATANVPDTTTTVPDTSTTNVPQTTSPPANQTATTNETTTTPQSTDTSKSSTQNDQTQTGSSEAQSSNEDSTTSNTGTEGNDNKSDSSTESTNEESTSTDTESTSEETEQSTDETGNESDETEDETEPVEEESTEEESTEEEEQEEESTEEEEEESTEEEEETEEEETEEEPEEEEKQKKKKKRKRNLAPPIITANVTTNQDLLGSYSSAINIGISRSSLMGDKTYSFNAMIWQNMKQFMASVGYSKVFLNKNNRAEWVYSTALGASRMFINTSANWNHSLVHLGKKGSVAGLSVSVNSLWTEFRSFTGTLGIMVDFEQQIVGASVTSFYTKPFKFGRVGVSPMIAASYNAYTMSVFDADPPQNKDVMFIAGATTNYTLTKRFTLNIGVNVVKSTAKEFPYLTNFSIGSRFSF